MSHTKHTCYRTQSRVTFADIAAWALALFPFATLLALVLFFPETIVDAWVKP